MTSTAQLQSQLGLERKPIAIAFLDAPPRGVEPWSGGPMPAGCAFWQQAWSGRSFYTIPADHFNCPIGCHTHNIPVPPEQAEKLSEAVGLMVSNEYVRSEEVPEIPTLAKAPSYVAYGPVDVCGFKPDVVLMAVRPAKAMIVYEAALKAGASNAVMSTTGRPACAALPLASSSGHASLSLGCLGNRMRTGIADEEMYLAIPGDKWDAVCDAALEALNANSRMSDYYAAADAEIGQGQVIH